jgi:hypothetical protein
MTGHVWDAPFTTPPNSAADEVIAGHMRHIRDAILALPSRNVGSIVLTGGFGRGEGGVASDGRGSFQPINDYDILVVTRGNGLPARLRLRRRLKALEPALSRTCGVRVDIACKTPRMMRDFPHTVDACETALGYRLLWGDAAPLEAIRWREPARLPAVEAIRYLFNRGAALLWARRMLEPAAEVNSDQRQFIWIAIQKARLSWGDALLLWHGRYTIRYSERMDRLAGITLPPELAGVSEAYREALRFKLQPDFAAIQTISLPDVLAETIDSHEVVWRWMETAMGAPARSGMEFWLRRYGAARPVLREADSPPGVGARLYRLALNLWRVRPRSRRLLFEHPDERLARVLPLLLFGAREATLPWPALGRLLGVSQQRLRAQPAATLADRLIEIWHPGPPY